MLHPKLSEEASLDYLSLKITYRICTRAFWRSPDLWRSLAAGTASGTNNICCYNATVTKVWTLIVALWLEKLNKTCFLHICLALNLMEIFIIMYSDKKKEYKFLKINFTINLITDLRFVSNFEYFFSFCIDIVSLHRKLCFIWFLKILLFFRM